MDFTAALNALPPLPVAGARAEVANTADLQRIRSAPWRPWQDAADLESGRAKLDAWAKKEQGTMQLLPVQAATLGVLMHQARQGRGVFAPIRTGGGKFCLDETLVATPGGWKRHGDLRVGDQVIGSDGLQTEVLGVYPQSARRILRIDFSDGTHALSSEDHLWTFQRKHRDRGRITQPLCCWEKTKLSATNGLAQGAAHSFFLPMIEPVVMPAAVLPIEPYTLGALIGDGGMTQCSIRFTSMDDDIIAQLVLLGGEWREEPTRSRARELRLKDQGAMRRALAELGLHGKRSEHKFLPVIYKRASADQRLALLHGLFDTDGTPSSHGAGVSYSTSSPVLATDVQEVVESLGGTARIGSKATAHLPHYRLEIRLPLHMPRFRCARKRGRPATSPQRKGPYRAVLSITDTGRVEGGSCIRVAAEDHLYAIQHYHLTHNTLISLLAPECTNLSTLLLVPASLRDKTSRAAYALAKHYRIRPVRMLSYEGLSQAKNAEILLLWKPELIVCDEAHLLGDSSGTRWNRIKRYRAACVKEGRPGPIPLLMSGSFTSRSLREYWHLIRWCLGEDAPLPRDFMEMARWGLALDTKIADGMRVDPGALLSLAPPAEADGTGRAAARARYGRRLMATHGVIGTGSDVPANGLEITVTDLKPSDAIRDAAEKMRMTWQTPCGLPFETAFELWRHERELSAGLYYRWTKPAPEPWLIARKELSCAVRKMLSSSRTLDTPLQVYQAAHDGRQPHLLPLIAAWQAVEPTFKPVTEPVWICDSTLEYAATWLAKERGICWVHHRAFGERLSALTGVPYFAEQGQDVRGISIDMHDGPAIASQRSCSRGFDLQGTRETKACHWQNLVITPPTKNNLAEQLVSRTHRDGQAQPTVFVEFLLRLDGDRAALAQARADATMVAATLRQPQRLTVATWMQE